LSTSENGVPEKTDSEKSTLSKEDRVKILDTSVEKAIEQYKKVNERPGVELTEKEIAEIDKQCDVIRDREIIAQDIEHNRTEIITKNGEIITGPPILTRFEKARIMGASALQLSLGAPVFIEIPKNATTSLEIAMEELNKRVIPIVIRRTLPNSDYQNIPIDKFQ